MVTALIFSFFYNLLHNSTNSGHHTNKLLLVPSWKNCLLLLLMYWETLKLVGHEEDQLEQETKAKDQCREIRLHLSLLKEGQGNVVYVVKLVTIAEHVMCK
jgi:hypothetical protein